MSSSDITMSKPDEEVATTQGAQATTANPASSPAGKGKGKEKSVAAPQDEEMEEDHDDEEDDEEEEEGEEEEDDDEPEEDMSEIDPRVIIPSDGGRPRRNRPQVDYTSEEAIKKAGVSPTDDDD